jgi:hypothetical protein
MSYYQLVTRYWILAISISCGCEFPWACGPPMEMKVAFPRPIDSK